MTRGIVRFAAAATAGLVLVLATAAAASAHPLGNFTINHYAGLRVTPRSVAVDVVIDMAEIPAFQERQQLDRNGDGTVDGAETEAARTPLCRSLSTSLQLTDDGPLSLELRESGLSFPAGSSGLPTLRLVCEFEASLRAVPAQTLTFADDSYAGRIGWREIVVDGDGATVMSTGGGPLLAQGVSQRLTRYPTDLLSAPLAMSEAQLTVRPGGPAFVATAIPDAFPIAASRPTTSGGSIAAIAGAVPGGAGDSLSGILQSRDLTPPVVLASLLVALVLGAAHALSPGHGKTVMAAYLIGARGSAAQAAALGLVVTVSHTLGVLAVAAIVLAASDLFPPERIYPVLSVIAGLLVVAIGTYLVFMRLRELAVARWRPNAVDSHEHALEHGHGDGDGHTHEHAAHEHAADGHTHDHAHEHPHDHAHEHPHDHAHEHPHDHGDDHGDVHSHGIGPFRHRHTHMPADGQPATLRWRSLAALGLAGGLVPSASAVLLLLGSLAAGRAGYGVVLVLAFGAGMAVVLVGIGLTLVYAGRLAGRVRLGRPALAISRALPTLTAVAVLVGGVLLTIQALHPVL